MSTYAIRRRGLQAEIQDIVKRYIIDHRFKPGDALPGEGELAKQMGISRPSLREAMKVLQTIGVVETRHGSGTYVGSLSMNPFTDGMAFQILIAAQHSQGAPQDLIDLVELRKAVEVSQIRKAAGQHSDEQIARMRAMCDGMAKMGSEAHGFGEQDLALHQMFYQPLHSRVYSEFLRMFWRISNLAIMPYAKSSRESVLAQHREIVEALANHDADAAARAVEAHVESLASTIETSYDPESLHIEALASIGSAEPVV